jgi:hypothetical protein
MEDLKFSSEIRLKKKGQKIEIPPTYITSKALNEKLPNPHPNKPLNSKPKNMNLDPIYKIWNKSKYPLQLQQPKLNI